jgi:tetratricopeptide (TPR) repeat protein
MVGRALEAADVRELRRNAPLVAHHFAFAGSRPDLVRAIELWTLAGGWARSQAAFESAAEHWRAALLLMERTGATFEEHARLLERYGQLLCVTGIDHRSGVAALEQAMGLYAEAGLAHRRAAVHAKLGVALSTFPEFFELRAALRHFRAAEELLDGTGDDQRLARVQLGSAAVAIQQLAPGPGAEAAARCLDLAERLGDDGLWATAAAVAAFHAGAEGRLTDMFELIERAHIAADRGLSASGRFTATWLESTIWFALGNPRQLLTAVGPRLDQFAQAPARSATMHEFLAHAYALSGRVDEATIELAAVDRQQYFGGPSVDFAAGDWSAAKSTLQQLLTRDRLAGNRAFECFGYLLLVRIQRAQREFEEAARLLNQCLELALGGPNRLVESWCRSELALVLACAGRSEESRTEIRHCRELLDDSCWIARTVAVDLAEAIITSQLGRSADAQVLADRAFSTCEHVGLPFDEADARQLWADCLRANGDEFSAQRAESRAAAILEAIQAGGSWTGLRALGNRQPAGRDVFVREGEYWTVQFAGTTARVKHVKGLSFIAELLHHPGEEIHALELVAAVEGHAGTPATASLRGDAGPALDSQAKREYRQRLSELAQDLSEAETFHDLGRTAKIQAEIDAITDELTRALGLGGRDRRVASASERARVSVTKRITAAVSRLEEAHPALGNHFASTLRTGSYCSYQPDSRLRTNWQT